MEYEIARSLRSSRIRRDYFGATESQCVNLWGTFGRQRSETVRKASLCAYFVVRRADALQFSRSSVSFLTRAGRTNRLLVILITGAVGVLGVIAATMLRQELLPSLDVTATQVVVTVPGASPGVVVEEIAMPVEAAGT